MKPKFNIQDYADKTVMHCKTAEEAKIFCKYMYSIGLEWCNGDSYLGTANYDEFLASTCYNFNTNMVDSVHTYSRRKYKILEFNDFDWSDFMKKEFTKKDLKNGDVVKYRNGRVGIVILETGTVILENDDYMGVDDICDDLTDKGAIYPVNSKGWDIVAVRRPMESHECRLCAFDRNFGELVYERKEVEEMTLEEVCKALGKEIKIVKK